MTKGNSRNQIVPRKLAALPIAASLLTPLASQEYSRRHSQLLRIVSITVPDSFRDKNDHLILKTRVLLRPENPRARVGIFVPNNAPVKIDQMKTFEDVNQLNKLLTYCGRPGRDDDHSCRFCTELNAYLRSHWTSEPLLVIGLGGTTGLRKGAAAKFLSQLVEFAIEKPRVGSANASIEGDTMLDMSAVCAAQREVVCILFDFLDMNAATT